MTNEEFTALLLEIRNQATHDFTTAVAEETRSERALVDATHRRSVGEGAPLAVWHAAEIALGMLDDKYIPKREALEDVRALAVRYDDDDESEGL